MMPSFVYENAPLVNALTELGSRLDVAVVLEFREQHKVTGDYASLGITAAFLKACSDAGVSAFWDANKKVLWISDSLPKQNNDGVLAITLVTLPAELSELLSRAK